MVSIEMRHAAQIEIQLNYMTDIYNKLEKLQQDCAVARSARPMVSLTYVLYMNSQKPAHILIPCAPGRPDTQKQILQLCASCTKTDVALNNLVVRARIGQWDLQREYKLS